ncbi:hypothetical protein L6452_19162 [Arctium lappa]|uniref:Uncharacterized protein n=1 Tax=Arctium lappa TaxID=4217 RepID=A0ACB9B8N9_ARCLA|nr:hypothetical protein L6452_19162 [Arctium lappa]
MMGVSPSHGEASVSKPSSDNQTDDLPTPLISINIPQSLLKKPTSPITHTYIRKNVKKVSSLLVPSPTKPSTPLIEHSPLENIKRETTGVSPNPKKVLNKEKEEHIGCKAHTTDFAQSAGQDGVNISKTFPMATLGEQSSKGPICQETKGVEGASARQKTSTTKRSKDPSRVVNTPKGGEDRYNYQELMDTIGNINLDVIKRGSDIEEMKLVILSQQVQITKLKKMVMKLVQKNKRKQYVLKKSGDAFNKAEKQDEGEKHSPIGMEDQFKGELNKETENSKAAETEPAAVTEKEVETEKTATETSLSREEMEIAETLVKANNDTPKAT